MNSIEPESTMPQSGHGPATVVPPEVMRWNWGAFLLHWIWGIFNNTFIALLCLIPFVNLVMIFILGIKGNEWAWRNKQWQSIEHFHDTQKKWAIAALCWWTFVMFSVCGGVAVTLFTVGKALSSSKPYQVAIQTAKSNPQVVAILGDDIEQTGFPNGSINIENSSGKCDLVIGLKGSKGEGKLYVKGEKEADKWTFSMIKFGPLNSDTRIDLLSGISNEEKTIIDPAQPLKFQ